MSIPHAVNPGYLRVDTLVNIISMVAKKKITEEHTQKEMKRKIKYFYDKNQLNIKHDSNARNGVIK